MIRFSGKVLFLEHKMSKPSKRKLQLRAARESRNKVNLSRPCGSVIPPPQPPNDARNQSVLVHECVCCGPTWTSFHRAPPKKRQKPNSRQANIQPTHPPTEAETKGTAVADLRILRAVAKVKGTRVVRAEVKKIANRLCITPGHLRRLAQWSSVRSLVRLPGSGRRLSAGDRTAKNWLLRKSHELGGAWTTRMMADLMHVELGRGSQSTVIRLAQSLGFRRVYQRVRPLLSFEAKKRRLEWANQQLATKPKQDEVHVHVDEKWFFSQLLKQRFWVAPCEKPPQIELNSKTHISKVMFLGAVARPVPAHQFTGRVGLYPIAEQKAALRGSKNHAKGDLTWKLVNMDTALFKKLLQESVVPDVLAATGTWAKRIVIQMDNAGGHGGGRGDINKTTLSELNQWAKNLPEEFSKWFPEGGRPLVEFIAQPPRSPDTNALDLGIWTSLQVAVKREKQKQGKRDLKEEVLINICKEAWLSWDAEKTLTKIFQTLENVLLCIQDAEGGNCFDIPHSKDLFF